MSTISRRTALTGGTAAIAVAVALPTAALAQGPHDDTALLSKIREFHASYDEWVDTWNKSAAQRRAIEALPDFPDWATSDPKDVSAFIRGHQQPNYWALAVDQGTGVGKLVNEVFATAGHTPKGILEKARILFLALGESEGKGNEDLEAYQVPEDDEDDEDGRWVRSVMSDLEALAGRAQS